MTFTAETAKHAEKIVLCAFSELCGCCYCRVNDNPYLGFTSGSLISLSMRRIQMLFSWQMYS